MIQKLNVMGEAEYYIIRNNFLASKILPKSRRFVK